MSDESKVYPRIWDRFGERKMIGETRTNWIVVYSRDENAPWIQHIEWMRENPSDWIGFRCSWRKLIDDGRIVLVNKKNPNKDAGPFNHPDWFFSEADFLAEKDRQWVYTARQEIADKIRYSRDIPADALRQIAALIGYEPEGK